MMKRFALPVGAAVLCAAAGAVALAQMTAYGVRVTSPVGSELVSVTPFVGGTGPTTGMNQVVALTQIRDAQGYSKQVPVTSFSITFPANTSRLILNPAGTLAAGTILTPIAPYDGQEMCVWSTQIVTSLTMTASPGQTLNGGLSALVAGGAQITGSAACWTYSLSNTTWDRSS